MIFFFFLHVLEVRVCLVHCTMVCVTIAPTPRNFSKGEEKTNANDFKCGARGFNSTVQACGLIISMQPCTKILCMAVSMMIYRLVDRP